MSSGAQRPPDAEHFRDKSRSSIFEGRIPTLFLITLRAMVLDLGHTLDLK